MEGLRERIATARQALVTLDELVDISAPSKIERDAAIQRFKYSSEATWKAAQLYLRETEGVEAGSPKGVIRASLQAGIFDEDAASQALAMVDDRNLTSHTYNEKLAEAIFSRLPTHAAVMGAWLKKLDTTATPRTE